MEALHHTLINPDDTDLPLLILGTPLGTSAQVWASVAHRLRDHYQVAVTELPGHGLDAAAAPLKGMDSSLSISDIAFRTVAVANELNRDSFYYAGCSISGAVAQTLALEHPNRVEKVTALCTADYFGGPEPWQDRVRTIAAGGTRSVVGDTAERWFAAGFLDEDIAAGHIILEQLAATNDEAYIACCMALGGYDLRGRISDITVPILYVAGSQDFGNSPESMQALAEQAPRGSFALIPDAAHIVMAEHPELVAETLQAFFAEL